MEIENISSFDDLKNKIYVVRGVKVMLDADLADIYGYTTKAFNQQVKNNIGKFDDDFRLQLTKEEYYGILRSKILTIKSRIISYESNNYDNDNFLRSNLLTSKTDPRGGRQYLPYAFTEQGIYMLMTVLKGELATKQSKALIRVFKEMKDFIIDNRSLIGSKELIQLSVQTVQNTTEIAEIKQNMATKADLAKVIHDFTDPQTRREYLILNGESVEANIAYASIYQSAKQSVFVIDNYIGIKTLALLKNVSEHIPITVFSDNIGRGLHQSDYADFQRQYPRHYVSFRKTGGIYHDRYIVLDYNTLTEKIYHCGASSKDAGSKVTTISEVTDRSLYHPLVDALVGNPVLVLS